MLVKSPVPDLVTVADHRVTNIHLSGNVADVISYIQLIYMLGVII